MAHLVKQFIDCQKAFWNKATTAEKLNSCSFGALTGMANYVGLHILKENIFLGAAPLLGFVTLPFRDISNTTTKTTIVASFITIFYLNNLRDRIVPWQFGSVVALGGFIYSSTVKGHEILSRS